tara:strand:- start:1520 stop:2212 length:693 start_codon:yes stop_codon:yes gene_type:complete
MSKYNTRVENLYDSIASEYENIYENRDVIEAENFILAKLLNQKYNGRLLDVGCGTGFFLDLAKDYDIYVPKNNYIGLDISQNMLDIAQKKHIGYRFFKSDFMNLPRADKFDFIISLFSVSDYEGSLSLRQSAKLLNDSGVFMGTFINEDEPFEMDCLKETGNQYDLHKFTHKGLLDELSKSGFTWYYIVSIAKIPSDITDVNIMKHYLDIHIPVLAGAKYFFVTAGKDET